MAKNTRRKNKRAKLEKLKQQEKTGEKISDQNIQPKDLVIPKVEENLSLNIPKVEENLSLNIPKVEENLSLNIPKVKSSYLEKLLNPVIPETKPKIVKIENEKKDDYKYLAIPYNKRTSIKDKNYEFWLYSNQDQLYDTYLKFIDSEELFPDFCCHAYFTRNSNQSLFPSETIKPNSYTLLNQMQEYAFDRDYSFFRSTEIPIILSEKYLELIYNTEEFKEREEQWILI